MSDSRSTSGIRSSVSSLVSPIRHDTYHHSLATASSFASSPTGPYDTSNDVASNFEMLARNDSSSNLSSDRHSGDRLLNRSNLSASSGSSGLTIYSDAQESPQGPHNTRNREQSHRPDSTNTQGLVTVTPIKSSARESLVSLHGFGLNGHRIYSSSANDIPNLDNENAAMSTASVASSPLTPGLRRTPAHRNTDMSKSASRSTALRTSSLAHSPDAAQSASSPRMKRPRRPLAPIINQQPTLGSQGERQPSDSRFIPNNGIKKSGIRLVLGRPRDVSSNPSIASSHASSQADSDGHIEPVRVVGGPQLSFIRHSGRLVGSRKAIYAGMPRAPYLPRSESAGSDLKRVPHMHEVILPHAYEDSFDIYGRRHASLLVSILLLLACVAFPPAWLMLGTGYLDSLVGIVNRKIKLLALALAIFTLAAGSALVIIFSIVRDV